MNKIKVAVIFGGVSSEHEVSRVSAESIINNISKKKYEVICIGITKEGKWFWYTGETNKIGSGEWESDSSNKEAFISPDASKNGLIVFDGDKYSVLNIDVVFPVLHGKNGEDGTIQGLFEMSGISYVGCGTAASAICMDKVITNIMLTNSGIKKAAFTYVWVSDFFKDREKVMSEVEAKIQYPLFVKPANSGSSVGIMKANDHEGLIFAIEVAAEEDNKILFEEAINGREVECAIIGNDNPIASVVGEVTPSNEFYDYDAKYLSNASKTFIPAELDAKISDEIKEIALKAYKIMGCKGLSRVDFFVENDTNKILLNEINTLPGFTAISMYPKLLEACDIKYEDLIDRLIELAINK